jgi:hypothetical protein
MTNQHPIAPPLELVQQWWTDAQTLKSDESKEIRFIANVSARWGADQQLKLDTNQIAQAYQAGADQELEACCEEMKSLPSPLGIPFGAMASNALRAARRSKPPSLKEQALEWLIAAEELHKVSGIDPEGTIRRAIEALPE